MNVSGLSDKSNIKVFKKCIDKNLNIDCAINSIITEYDIKHAHPSALYFIYGEDKYKELLSKGKEYYTVECGKMILADKTLYEKIDKLVLSWFNRFCSDNNIKNSNFISSTRDSILLLNKKPIHTVYDDGVVEFRNKDGEFTTYLRFRNAKRELEILYDGMTNNIRIKGVNKELYSDAASFIKLLKSCVAVLESADKLNTGSLIKKMNYIRQKYMTSTDVNLYKSIMDDNSFVYQLNGERVLSSGLIPGHDDELVRSDNFVNFFIPILKLVMRSR